jgi:hypothetical protein
MSFDLPPPDLQVSFAFKLTEARTLVLQDALKHTVKWGRATRRRALRVSLSAGRS